MAKKKAAVLENERKAFIYGEKGQCCGAVANGVPANVANEIFDEMTSFASYAFNKSHAAAYATIAYQTAYLKCHFYKEYMAALMTITLLDSTDKLYGYIADVGKSGVKILPLDINKSESGFVAEPEGIRFALLAVKSLGEVAIDRIVSERKSGGAFRSLQDFCTRVSGRDIHLRTVEALIKSGAFDGFGYTRREHLNACEDIMKSVTRSDGSAIEGQLDLFGMGAALPMEKKIERCGEFDEQQLLEFEHAALGMYISAHPIDRFECVISATRCVTSAQLIKACTDEGGMADKRFADGAEVDYAGMVRGRKMLKT